jgi:TusA-related sulfurtransferase
MSTDIDVTETLDVQGLSCPMPIVRTKSAVEELDSGAVLEVVATDPGSVSDIDGWASSTDEVTLLEQREDNDTYVHYMRKEAV